MKIYFVRHGKTLWNSEERFQGKKDSPLIEEGINQAKKLGDKLEKFHFDGLYSSTLNRTHQTIKNIFYKKSTLNFTPFKEFDEISFGELEGLNKDTAKSLYPKEFELLWEYSPEYNPGSFGGESLPHLKERVVAGIEKLIANHSESDSVLVVSHGMTLKVIFDYIFEHSDIKDFKASVPENTSLTIVDYNDGKFKVEAFSDCSHLISL